MLESVFAADEELFWRRGADGSVVVLHRTQVAIYARFTLSKGEVFVIVPH